MATQLKRVAAQPTSGRPGGTLTRRLQRCASRHHAMHARGSLRWGMQRAVDVAGAGRGRHAMREGRGC
eukprot:scaffold7735_cov1882-Prasinococcus_capsulatus_cf.AAC.1